MLNTPPLKLGALLALISSALAMMALSSCAVNVNLNANRLESPETSGERLHGAIDLALTGSNTLVAIPDPTATPAQASAPAWDRSGESFRPGVSFGLFERLDVALKVPVNAPALLQAKYQFLGAPERKAYAGNFAMALTAGVGLTEPGANVANPATGVNSRTDLTATTYDFSLIAGWRFAETWMVYGGPFFTVGNYTGNLSQSGSVSGNFPFNGHLTQTGGNLGLQLDSVLGALKLEEAWALASVGGVHQAGFFTGVALSYRY